MLGKDHISLTVFSVIPFIVPALFLNNTVLTWTIVFLLFAIIGSLLPDSDVKGKATIYYRFPILDFIMKNFVIWVLILAFNNPTIKRKIKSVYEVKNEHRGIMHSPVGVLSSSLILTIIFFIVLVGLERFNFLLVFIAFVSLVFGQLMHMLQDSCTVSGINWAFPFGVRTLGGTISTWNTSRSADPVDIRPSLYRVILVIYFFIWFLIGGLGKIPSSASMYYILIGLGILLLWFLFLVLSGARLTRSLRPERRRAHNFWLWKRDTVREIRKVVRRVTKH